MKKITKKKLKEILEQHELWLDSNEKEGKRADLSSADLRFADLRWADLRFAKLSFVDLTDATLTDAILNDATLTGVDLSRADLRFAKLRFATLTDANLFGADLRLADLSGANLTCANLSYTNLTYTDLTGANLTDAIIDDKEQYRKGIVLTEPMVGYKKSNEGKIITLEIPIGAKIFSINNNRRRTNKAKVIDMQGETELCSMRDASFKYHVGDEIEIEDFDENYNVECSTGVHFFLTRDEAENHCLF